MDLAGLPNTTCYLCAEETRWHVLEARRCVCVPFSQHEQMLRRLIHETITLGNGLIWVLGIKDGFFSPSNPASRAYFALRQKKNLDNLCLLVVQSSEVL